MEFNSAVNHINRKIKQKLIPETHVVANQVHLFSAGELKWLIQEYSGFSNKAIHFLVSSYIRDHDWPDVKAEILHNIQEEFGQETKGIPHLEIMRRGYRRELNIETDDLTHSVPTQYFLKRMERVFANDENSYVAGAVLALEMTAIPEFHILDTIVKAYAKMSDYAIGEDTKSYIDGHKDFEIGHAGRLEAAIKPYINTGNRYTFQQGADAVVMLMERWWDNLLWELEFVSKFDYKLGELDGKR